MADVLCSECRRRPALAVQRPIPRLGGKLKRVCRACTFLLDAQEALPIEQEVQILAAVDRAVARRRAAATNPSRFTAPVADVADVAEDQGHPLAQPTGRAAA